MRMRKYPIPHRRAGRRCVLRVQPHRRRGGSRRGRLEPCGEPACSAAPDLDPQPGQTVKGVCAHEKGVFDEIANARTPAGRPRRGPNRSASANQFESAIRKLIS